MIFSNKADQGGWLAFNHYNYTPPHHQILCVYSAHFYGIYRVIFNECAYFKNNISLSKCLLGDKMYLYIGHLDI
jgi:hypothetical protein